jgi:hypothetical protein
VPKLEVHARREPRIGSRSHACIEAGVERRVACEMCSDACLDEDNAEQMAR